MTTRLREYLDRFEDVATRYAGLPVEHIVRALRRELRAFEPAEAELIALAQQIRQREDRAD